MIYKNEEYKDVYGEILSHGNVYQKDQGSDSQVTITMGW